MSVNDEHEDTYSAGGYEEPAVYGSDEDADFSGIFEESGYDADEAADDGLIEVDYPEGYVPDMPEDTNE